MNTDFFYDVRWRHHTPVYQQGNIPMCWAPVTTDAVASLAIIQNLRMHSHPVVPPLAAQELIDWVPFKIPGYEAQQNKDGGFLGNVAHGFEYIKRYGVHVESVYPFRMNSGMQMQLDEKSLEEDYNDMIKNGRYPSYKGRHMERITIESYQTLHLENYSDPTMYVGELLKQLRHQPIAGGIAVNIEHFAQYRGKDIYVRPPQLKINENHAIMITGFGHECGGRARPFIEIKNSHGPQWGDGTGYGKILTDEVFVAWYPQNASIINNDPESDQSTYETNNSSDFPYM